MIYKRIALEFANNFSDMNTGKCLSGIANLNNLNLSIKYKSAVRVNQLATGENLVGWSHAYFIPYCVDASKVKTRVI